LLFFSPKVEKLTKVIKLESIGFAKLQQGFFQFLWFIQQFVII